jgi:hypothetical protein
MQIKTVLFYIGLLIVVATHTHMLVALMPQSQQTYHAYLNLAAAALILYGRR